jgi:hypothetical protein
MQAEFSIVSCLSDPIALVVLDVPAEFKERFDSGELADFDIANEFAADALCKAGINNFKCDSCYDSAFRVRFVHFIE